MLFFFHAQTCFPILAFSTAISLWCSAWRLMQPAHACDPRSGVIHACSCHVEGRAAPVEGKLQHSSSLPVSGWKGFSSTPPHSPNEVIKLKNGAWKQTCSWGQVASRDAAPPAQILLLGCVLKTGGKDEAISAMHLQRFSLQATTSTLHLRRNWEIFTLMSSSKHPEGNMTSVDRTHFGAFAIRLQEAKELLCLWGPFNFRILWVFVSRGVISEELVNWQERHQPSRFIR